MSIMSIWVSFLSTDSIVGGWSEAGFIRITQVLSSFVLTLHCLAWLVSLKHIPFIARGSGAGWNF